VGSIASAKRAAEAGFDFIVAQGQEAGGHVCGQLGLLALLPQVVDTVAPVPVLAAGGIVDRRGVSAAIALGASGCGRDALSRRRGGQHPSGVQRPRSREFG
jgi:NAD(P)H-dependent flavin oxidoreductase YrpB (nitropropane dioxygenase family)